MPGYPKHLRSPVATQEEVAPTAWPRVELTVNIPDMGAAHDEGVHAQVAESLDLLPSALGIGVAVGHHSAVPVQDEGLVSLI